MLRKHTIATALGFLALLGAVEVANARMMVTFGGTRGQVSSACTGAGRILIEGVDTSGVGFSWCQDSIRHSSVVCDDNGSCVGSNSSMQDRPAKGPKGAPRDGRLAGPPQSLSEQSSGGSSAAPAGGPAGAPSVPYIPDIMFIN